MQPRKREDDYYIVTDRWQNYTDVRLTEDVLRELEAYCDEFLVNSGLDVEGKSSGMGAEACPSSGKCMMEYLLHMPEESEVFRGSEIF